MQRPEQFPATNAAADDKDSRNLEITSSDDEKLIPPTIIEKPACRDPPIPFIHFDLWNLTSDKIQLRRSACDQASDYHAQVHMGVERFCGDDPPMTFERMGTIFKITRATVFHHRSGDDWSENSRERPTLRTEAEILKMRSFIDDCYAQSERANYSDRANVLTIKTGKVIRVDSIRHIIGRLSCFKIIRGV
jgi:hypothetical protein